jgi:hypothetical protein
MAPRYSPPNSRVLCGDLSNIRHEVCALQRTYFVRSCGPSLLMGPAYNFGVWTPGGRRSGGGGGMSRGLFLERGVIVSMFLLGY